MEVDEDAKTLGKISSPKTLSYSIICPMYLFTCVIDLPNTDTDNVN